MADREPEVLWEHPAVPRRIVSDGAMYARMQYERDGGDWYEVGENAATRRALYLLAAERGEALEALRGLVDAVSSAGEAAVYGGAFKDAAALLARLKAKP